MLEVKISGEERGSSRLMLTVEDLSQPNQSWRRQTRVVLARFYYCPFLSTLNKMCLMRMTIIISVNGVW